MDRSAEAITAYDMVVTRFGDAEDPALREHVTKALVNKGITLGQLGRSAEEITAYDAVVTRYGEAPAPALRGLIFTDPTHHRAGAGRGVTRSRPRPRSLPSATPLPTRRSGWSSRSRLHTPPAATPSER
jgi:hypothetical protein